MTQRLRLSLEITVVVSDAAALQAEARRRAAALGPDAYPPDRASLLSADVAGALQWLLRPEVLFSEVPGATFESARISADHLS